MVFSSVIFLLYFLPVVMVLYLIPSTRFRNAVLLVSSIFFYGWGEPKFVFVMLLSILLNYTAGLLLEWSGSLRLRKAVLVFAVIFNIGMLFFYKYCNFALQSFNQLQEFLHTGWRLPVTQIALPIGLSFFTFQGLSYVIDVYRRDVPAQRNLFYLALYISMFPQLIAGPIVRYSDVYGSISSRTVKLDDVYSGMRRFIIGLGKKVIIADIMAETADKIFNTFAGGPGQITAGMAWLGAVCYTMQIYFDFMGYSDMAIGLGRMFGFRFLENFDFPYISKSVTEFWRRWHISLSSWFRDYVYIPLGGNRRGNVYLHLLSVFVLTGLWHGAAFTFIFWGLWHGFFILTERVGKRRGLHVPLPGAGRWLYTMLVVMIGWVFFRINTIGSGFGFLKKMCGAGAVDSFVRYGFSWYADRQTAVTLALAVCISLGIPRMIRERISGTRFERCVRIAEYPFLWGVLLLSMMMIVNGNFSPFIYFRF